MYKGYDSEEVLKEVSLRFGIPIEVDDDIFGLNDMTLDDWDDYLEVEGDPHSAILEYSQLKHRTAIGVDNISMKRVQTLVIDIHLFFYLARFYNIITEDLFVIEDNH